ncbi:MAG: MBL fold metallo-hydrolase [Desulfurococcales archaeon]|nr:MBL fold metallo-hydrolase [Desulfurococcales archaeon]
MVYLDTDIFIQIPLDPIGLKSSLMVYALKTDEGWILIDAGPESTGKTLLSGLTSYGVKPSKVFLTHIHLDHAGAVSSLYTEWNDVKFIVHPKGAPHLANPSKLWSQSSEVLGWLAHVFGIPSGIPKNSIITANDGEKIVDILKVIYTPGHASHHMSLFAEDLAILFPGSSIGMFMPLGNTYVYIPALTYPLKLNLYLESLEKQLNLEPQVVAMPHFGVHDAGEVFSTARNQLDEWIKTAQKAVDSGASRPERVLADMIVESDSVGRAWEYSMRYDPLMEKIMLVIAKGLLEHLSS